MSKPRFTRGPWKHDTESNIGNLVKGPSGAAPLYDGDNCMRAIATVQACCASQRRDEQEENCAANIALIAAAPELYEALELVSGLDIHHEALRVVDAALRKARGEA